MINGYKASKRDNDVNVDDVLAELDCCAYSKHKVGRHEIVVTCEPKIFEITPALKDIFGLIFSQMSANPMQRWLLEVEVNQSDLCFKNILDELQADCKHICEKTYKNFRNWMEERKHRISGARIYSIYTYSSNKNPDWATKCKEHFNPSQITSQYTEHGIKNEDAAREVFCEKNSSFEVYETGLLVSPVNSWLSISPDGVIFINGKPYALLEIKCPYQGKEVTILEAIKSNSFKTCLATKKGQPHEFILPLRLKEKHKYYAQIQLGMFMLNVKKTYFVMYASFDKSIETIEVNYDEKFVTKMLKTVKQTYFNIMLHAICDKNLCKKPLSTTKQEI